MKVFIDFLRVLEDGTFLEVRSPGKESFQDMHVRHISGLTRQEMARHLAEGDCFTLFSDYIHFVSSNIHASLLKRLMAVIPADKCFFIWCPVENSESTLKTLIRYCRHFKLQAGTGEIHPNLEIQVVGVSSSSVDYSKKLYFVCII